MVEKDLHSFTLSSYRPPLMCEFGGLISVQGLPLQTFRLQDIRSKAAIFLIWASDSAQMSTTDLELQFGQVASFHDLFECLQNG